MEQLKPVVIEELELNLNPETLQSHLQFLQFSDYQDTLALREHEFIGQMFSTLETVFAREIDWKTEAVNFEEIRVLVFKQIIIRRN